MHIIGVWLCNPTIYRPEQKQCPAHLPLRDPEHESTGTASADAIQAACKSGDEWEERDVVQSEVIHAKQRNDGWHAGQIW